MFNLFKKRDATNEIIDQRLARLEEERQPDTQEVLKACVRQAPYELKIKQVSLGLEIRLIKANEKRLERRQTKARARTKPDNWGGISRRESLITDIALHRCDLQTEARATNLARAFLKGKPYSSVENKCHEGNKPPMLRALEIAQKFAEGDKRTLAQAFERWDQEAMAYWEANKIPPLTPAQQGQLYLRRLLRRGEQLSLTPEQRRAKHEAHLFPLGDPIGSMKEPIA